MLNTRLALQRIPRTHRWCRASPEPRCAAAATVLPLGAVCGRCGAEAARSAAGGWAPEPSTLPVSGSLAATCIAAPPALSAAPSTPELTPALAPPLPTRDGCLPGTALRLAVSADRAALWPVSGADDGRGGSTAAAGSKPPSSELVAEEGLDCASCRVTSVLAGVPARRPSGGWPEVVLTRGVTNREVPPLQPCQVTGREQARWWRRQPNLPWTMPPPSHDNEKSWYRGHGMALCNATAPAAGLAAVTLHRRCIIIGHKCLAVQMLHHSVAAPSAARLIQVVALGRGAARSGRAGRRDIHPHLLFCSMHSPWLTSTCYMLTTDAGLVHLHGLAPCC